MPIIIDQVSLEPKYFDNNILYHLFKCIKEKFTGTCSSKNGYILRVNRLVRIISNRISSANSATLFNFEIDVETFKPVVGKQIKGSVCMITEDGLLAEDENKKINIFVPNVNMRGFTYHKNFFKKGNNTISEGSIIPIEITSIKFEEQFKCIGKIIDNTCKKSIMFKLCSISGKTEVNFKGWSVNKMLNYIHNYDAELDEDSDEELDEDSDEELEEDSDDELEEDSDDELEEDSDDELEEDSDDEDSDKELGGVSDKELDGVSDKELDGDSTDC